MTTNVLDLRSEIAASDSRWSIQLDDAMDDPRIKQLLNDIACGKESMCAPFPGMHQPMSQEEKRALSKAMMKVKTPR